MRRCLSILIVLMFTSCKDIGQPSISKKQILPKVEVVKVKKRQSLLHENLSKTLNYQSFIKRIPTEYTDSCIVKIVVSGKTDKNIVYETDITSTYLLGNNTFANENVRSYITGKNINKDVIDNDYGDLVVADFNFDGLEDFAIKREEGGNAGPFYNFYIQSTRNTFAIDKYLSDTIISFPNEMDFEQKKVTNVSKSKCC